MPQARSGGSSKSGSGSGASRSSGSSRSGGKSRSSSSRSSSSRASTGRSSASRSTKSRSTSARSTASRGATRTAHSRSAGGDARLEAAAQRVRKINERIIEAGKDAGESTLSSYEKILKSIAATIESGPGASDIEWVSNLATAQAKFLRDLATSWTSAARKMLK